MRYGDAIMDRPGGRPAASREERKRATQAVAFAEPRHHHACHNSAAYTAGRGRKPDFMAVTVSARPTRITSAEGASAEPAAEALLPDILLDVSTVSKRFGGVRAVGDVSIAVRRGAIASIIGPNGAGKTSLLNMISGFYRPDGGSITFEGIDTTRYRPADIAALGIARTFQNIALFGGMTVLDNIMLGRHVHMKSGLLSAFVYWGLAQKEEIAHRERCEELIDFLELQDLRKQPTSALAYGLRKRVELARALALEPKLLLLDEPMGGMNQEEKEDMARYIIDVNEEWGTTIILIEHDMAVVMDISDHVTVLDRGLRIAHGTPTEVQRNPEVIRAYLGGGERRERAA